MKAIIFVAMLIASYLASFSVARTLGPYGAYQIIRNLKDPHVMAIAEFAVSDYNLKTSKQLLFSAIVEAARRIQDGLYYRLDIRVSSGAMYETVVFESRAGALKVVSFEPKSKV